MLPGGAAPARGQRLEASGGAIRRRVAPERQGTAGDRLGCLRRAERGVKVGGTLVDEPSCPGRVNGRNGVRHPNTVPEQHELVSLTEVSPDSTSKIAGQTKGDIIRTNKRGHNQY